MARMRGGVPRLRIGRSRSEAVRKAWITRRHGRGAAGLDAQYRHALMSLWLANRKKG